MMPVVLAVAPDHNRSPSSRSLAVFFFSSRRRHTRFDCDWSSDVCSSDLLVDPRSDWHSPDDAIGDPNAATPTGVTAVGTNSKNAALFFPRLRQPNPLKEIGRASCRGRG